MAAGSQRRDGFAAAPTSAQLGQAVRELRLARELTIEALADDSDTHFTYLSGIERGVRNPTWNKIRQLAQALEIPPSELVRHAEVVASEERSRVERA